jgi:hypothetical protein
LRSKPLSVPLGAVKDILDRNGFKPKDAPASRRPAASQFNLEGSYGQKHGLAILFPERFRT